MNQWEVWGRRIAVALALAVIGAAALWTGMALAILLSSYLPVSVLWVLGGAIFAVTVAADWAIDTYRARRLRDRYEIARRAALGLDDDEL